MSETSAPKMHIAFASAEAAPFVKTGGLGDVAGSLPQALKAAGAEVVVLVPKYDSIAQEYKDRMEHLCDFYVPLGWRNEYCGLERLVHNGVDYLFIDNERYFSRGYPYGFFDDGERFAFFSKAIVEALQYLPHVLGGFACDVLHCNDWHTAMAPVFLREFYQGLPLYENVKCVFSIHNIAFQGQFTAKILNDILGLAHIPAAAFQLTCGPDAINYMQGALNYTDAITTVSPTYAEEIKTPDFGEHLDGILRRRAPILQGIVNGIDTTGFDPATDPRIAANFTAADRSGKAVCKAELQRELGLEVRDDRPLMVMVTRLTRQKGMDLVTYALDRILSGGVQVAVLGTGDTEYENALRYFEGKYPGTMAARIQFDPALSQRMYAGADLFLMPSLFEPCGLSQMIAMRYGTLPIVRETGGLSDTVAPYNQFTGEGTGFSFAHFNGDEMGDAVFRAARLFWDDRAAFNKLVDNAMGCDFSWTRSAKTYMELYHNLHPEIPLPEPPAPKKTPAKPKAKSTRTRAKKVATVTEQLPLENVAASEAEAGASGATDAAPAVDGGAVSEAPEIDSGVVAPDTPAADGGATAAEMHAADGSGTEGEAPAKKTAAKKPATKRTTTRKTAAKATADDAKAEGAAANAEADAPAAKATKGATAKKATKTATAKTAAAKKTSKVTAAKTTDAASEETDSVETATEAAVSTDAASASEPAKPAAKTTTRKPAARKTTAAVKKTAAAPAPAEPAVQSAEVEAAPKASTSTRATPMANTAKKATSNAQAEEAPAAAAEKATDTDAAPKVSATSKKTATKTTAAKSTAARKTTAAAKKPAAAKTVKSATEAERTADVSQAAPAATPSSSEAPAPKTTSATKATARKKSASTANSSNAKTAPTPAPADPAPADPAPAKAPAATPAAAPVVTPAVAPNPVVPGKPAAAESHTPAHMKPKESLVSKVVPKATRKGRRK
ncbi:MAG: glycogen synthase GlgA [Coriobacteriaceae bacterium]|nr:glycogen synthase GlgA [Coriobacteriaceae bacterium]